MLLLRRELKLTLSNLQLEDSHRKEIALFSKEQYNALWQLARFLVILNKSDEKGILLFFSHIQQIITTDKKEKEEKEKKAKELSKKIFDNTPVSWKDLMLKGQ